MHFDNDIMLDCMSQQIMDKLPKAGAHDLVQLLHCIFRFDMCSRSAVQARHREVPSQIHFDNNVMLDCMSQHIMGKLPKAGARDLVQLMRHLIQPWSESKVCIGRAYTGGAWLPHLCWSGLSCMFDSRS